MGRPRFARRSNDDADPMNMFAVTVGVKWDPAIGSEVPSNARALPFLAFQFEAGVGAAHFRKEGGGLSDGSWGPAVTAGIAWAPIQCSKASLGVEFVGSASLTSDAQRIVKRIVISANCFCAHRCFEIKRRKDARACNVCATI